MKLPLVGPYGKGRHPEVNAREAVNLYCEVVDTGGKEKMVWLGPPGLKAFGTPTAVVRGKPLEWDDLIYYVSADKLYSMDSTDTETELGTLTSNSGNNVSLTRNRTQLLIVDGTAQYHVYDTVAATMTVVDKFSTESDITDIEQISSTAITAIENTAGDTYNVSSTAHGGKTSDSVTITDSVSFSDTYVIAYVDANNYTVEQTGSPADEVDTSTITDITNVAGDTYNVVAVGHGGVTSDSVLISGTGSFNGTYTLTRIDDDNYTIEQAGSPADEVGISATSVIQNFATSLMHRYEVAAISHGGSNGDSVLISGSTNFDYELVIDDVAPNTFTIGGTTLASDPADETSIVASAFMRVDAITITPSMGASIDGYGLLNNTVDTTDSENGVSKQAFFRTRADDFTTIQALHFSAAQFSPDDLTAIFVTGGDIWLLGDDSAELWYNNGTDADFPLEPARSAVIPFGIAAPWSITELGSGVAWLSRSTRGEVVPVIAEGYQPNPTSNHAIAYHINTDSDANILAATAQSYEEDGHQFWVLTVGSNTWVYDHAESKATSSKMWHKRESYSGSTYEQYRGKWYVRAFSKHLWTDRENAKILEADLGTNTELDGSTSRQIRRYGVSGFVHSDDQKTFHDRLGILMAATGGSLVISYSDDAGTTWTTWTTKTVARLVEEWTAGLAEVDRIYKVQTVSDARTCIIGAYLDVKGEDANS